MVSQIGRALFEVGCLLGLILLTLWHEGAQRSQKCTSHISCQVEILLVCVCVRGSIGV